MARKRKKKQTIAAKRAYQKTQRPSNRLQEALDALAAQDLATAATIAKGVLQAARDEPTQKKTKAVIGESLFRMAASTTNLKARLNYLNEAIGYQPEDARLHYHQGVTLALLGQIDAAAETFGQPLLQQSERATVNYLTALTQLGRGLSWRSAQLSTAEAETLTLVEQLTTPSSTAPATTKIAPSDSVFGPPELWQGLLQMQNKPKATPAIFLDNIKQGVDAPSSPVTSKAGRAVVDYYMGVAAMRKGAQADAQLAWNRASQMGFASPWFEKNLADLLREKAVKQAQDGRWAAVIKSCKEHPNPSEDKVLVETLGLALYHLGYESAQAGRWRLALKHWREAGNYVSGRQLAQNLALAEEAVEHHIEAATAWREMIKRRPRKKDHPDYLTDGQVAAIWNHIADCYMEKDYTDDAIVCLKNAVKYAPEHLELRLKLADIHLYTDSEGAAENEVKRILEINPDYVPALIRIGVLHQQNRRSDAAKSSWLRALELEPENEDAKAAVISYYLGQVQAPNHANFFERFRTSFYSTQDKIDILEEGLKAIPGQPRMLALIGKFCVKEERYEEATSYLVQAWDAAPDDPSIVNIVLHELLHAGGDEIVLNRLPAVRNIDNLLAGFWIDQGAHALYCELEQVWIDRFWDEAIAQSEKHNGLDTKAYALAQIFQTVHAEDEFEIADQFEARIRQEVPTSGAVEFVEAYRLYHEEKNRNKALQRLRKSKRLAKKAKEEGLLNLISNIEMLLSNTRLNSLIGMIDPANPEKSLFELLGNMDEEVLDELRDIMEAEDGPLY